MNADWADSDIDARHRVVGSVVWDLPLGFQFAGLFAFQTGYPYSVRSGFDDNGDMNPNDYAVIDDSNRARAEAAGQDLADGLQGRNSARHPNFVTVDIRFGKVFDLGGAGNCEVLVDVFNSFNNANRFTTNTSIGSENFGFLNGLLTDPRQVQIGARYRF